MLNPIHLATPEVIFETINWALDRAQSHNFADRRISERTTVHLPVVIQPIDSNCHPVGEPFEAITRDVSVGGMGFVTTAELTCEQILVRFTSDDKSTTLVLDVHYCNQIGPFFFVGASFCADWSSEEE